MRISREAVDQSLFIHSGGVRSVNSSPACAMVVSCGSRGLKRETTARGMSPRMLCCLRIPLKRRTVLFQANGNETRSTALAGPRSTIHVAVVDLSTTSEDRTL